MSDLKNTKEVAQLLGIHPGRLSMALWDGRLQEPHRIGRIRVWDADDIARAARCFKIRWLRPVGPGGPDGARGIQPAAAAPAETTLPVAKE